MVEGYFDKMDRQAEMLRIAAYRIHQSIVTKPLDILDFWPLFTDSKAEKEKPVMSTEMYEYIINKHITA